MNEDVEKWLAEHMDLVAVASALPRKSGTGAARVRDHPRSLRASCRRPDVTAAAARRDGRDLRHRPRRMRIGCAATWTRCRCRRRRVRRTRRPCPAWRTRAATTPTTAILLGTALAIELVAAVADRRAVHLPAGEESCRACHRRRAAGGMQGSRGFSHCTATRGSRRQGWRAGRCHHFRGGHHRTRPRLAGRSHLPAAPDDGPGLRDRHGHHGCRDAQPPHRSA